MKKHIYTAAFFSVLVLLVLASCGNKEETKTRTSLLINGSWKFKSAISGGVDYSGLSQFPACYKDNLLTFSANGTGIMNEGATKCTATDPDNISYTWNFINNETTLHLSLQLFNLGITDFDIISLTATELIISVPYIRPVGPTIMVDVTFQH